MLEAIFAAFGLGLAGIDPIGAVLLMTMIAANFSRIKVILFCAMVLLSGVIAGTIVSVAGAGFIAGIKDLLPVSTSSVWVFVNLIIAAIILIWIVRRKLAENKPKREKEQRRLGSSFPAVIATGFLFGAGSVLDPTFMATISLAAQTESLGTTVVMHTVWMIVSQIMLFGLLIAYVYGRHERVIAYSREQYRKHKALLQNLLYVSVIAVFLFLVSDTLAYVFTGEYLINL